MCLDAMADAAKGVTVADCKHGIGYIQHGIFDVVSGDEDEQVFKVDSCDLGSWSYVTEAVGRSDLSAVLHEAMVSCSGPKRIQLPESATTIRNFIHLHKEADIEDPGYHSVLNELSDLAHFIKKYECGLARKMLLKVISGHQQRCWPPIVLLLVGEPLDDLTQFILFLNTFAGREDSLWESPLAPHAPKSIPRNAFMRTSQLHLWAIKMADVGNIPRAVGGRHAKKEMPPGERYRHYLELAEKGEK